MEDSILLTIKPLVNVELDDHDFDTDILVGINTALSVLSQVGVGPMGGLIVEDETATWSDLYTDDRLSMVRTFVHIKTKLIFDPPTNSAVLKALEEQASELIWRIEVAKDMIEGGAGNGYSVC